MTIVLPPTLPEDLSSAEVFLVPDADTVNSESRDEEAQPLLSRPFGVYVTLNDELPTGADPTAWQRLLFQDDDPIAIAEIVRTARSWVFAKLFPRQQAQCLVDSVARAERSPAMAEATFELRVLESPPRLLHALWFHAATADYLSLIEPIPGLPFPSDPFPASDLREAFARLDRSR